MGQNTLTQQWRNQEHKETQDSSTGALKIGAFYILEAFPFLYFSIRYRMPWSGISHLLQTQTHCVCSCKSQNLKISGTMYVN